MLHTHPRVDIAIAIIFWIKFVCGFSPFSCVLSNWSCFRVNVMARLGPIWGPVSVLTPLRDPTDYVSHCPHLKAEQIQFLHCFCLIPITDGVQSPNTQWFWELYSIVRTIQFLQFSYKFLRHQLPPPPWHFLSLVYLLKIRFTNCEISLV
jgi:hypothetical protein